MFVLCLEFQVRVPQISFDGVKVRERERQRETERERYRETETERQIQKARDSDRDTDTKTGRISDNWKTYNQIILVYFI